MPRRHSYSSDLARLAQRIDKARELLVSRGPRRAPRPESWPPPLPPDRIPVRPPHGGGPKSASAVPAPPAAWGSPAVARLRSAVPSLASASQGAAGSAPSSRVVPTPLEASVNAAGVSPHPRRWRWVGLVLASIVAASTAVIKVRPEVLPPRVSQAVARTGHSAGTAFVVVRARVERFGGEARRVTGALVLAPVARLLSSMAAAGSQRAALPPRGGGAQPLSGDAPPPAGPIPPVLHPDSAPSPAAQRVGAATPSPSGSGLQQPASEPPLVSFASLPVAPAARLATTRPTGRSSAITGTPARARAAAAAHPPVPATSSIHDQAGSSETRATPAAAQGPAPAPGSLDDLMRKAVEADSKKAH